MAANKDAQRRLNDLAPKLRNAKEAADAGAAGNREKADLKLLNQEVTAEKLKAERPAPAKEAVASGVDAKLDKALKDSFPGSDPVSFVQAAPINDGDRALPTVPDKDPNDKS